MNWEQVLAIRVFVAPSIAKRGAARGDKRGARALQRTDSVDTDFRYTNKDGHPEAGPLLLGIMLHYVTCPVLVTPTVVTEQFRHAPRISEVVLHYADGSMSRASGEIGWVGFELMDNQLNSYGNFIA